MNSLENYGIQLNGAAALQHADVNRLEAAEFFHESAALLGGPVGDTVKKEVIPNLEQYYGRWHPSGFMVYPLGSHPELGSLRLHIWPEGLRQRKVEGRGPITDTFEGRPSEIYDGDIHNHAWHISSLVLKYYSDNFYKVESAPRVDPAQYLATDGLYRVFSVRYRTATQPEALTTDGTCATASIESQREVFNDEFHTIEAGPFHAPTIPEDRLGATLVFNSSRVHPTGPDILIGGLSVPIIGNRLDVTRDESELVKKQLMAS